MPLVLKQVTTIDKTPHKDTHDPHISVEAGHYN
jgi:hypothetical protein